MLAHEAVRSRGVITTPIGIWSSFFSVASRGRARVLHRTTGLEDDADSIESRDAFSSIGGRISCRPTSCIHRMADEPTCVGRIERSVVLFRSRYYKSTLSTRRTNSITFYHRFVGGSRTFQFTPAAILESKKASSLLAHLKYTVSRELYNRQLWNIKRKSAQNISSDV
jgi:hypothetical protein